MQPPSRRHRRPRRRKRPPSWPSCRSPLRIRRPWRVVTEGLARAKEAADRTGAAVATAQAQVSARETVARAYAEAATKIKDAADKDKNNKDLVAAVARSRDLANQANAELAAGQKILSGLMPAAQAATEQLNNAQRASGVASTAATEANKALQARAPVAKAAADKAMADKVAAEQAAAALASARETLDHCRAAMSLARSGSK